MAKSNFNSMADNGSLNMYLNEIDRIPLLTREEEYELAVKAKAGDSYARERLANGNLRFVVSIAKQYQKRGLPLMDLISEGNIGLLTAIDKFDPDKGYHFISYAVWWVRQAILKALGEKSRMIRLPMNKSAELMQVIQAKSKLEEDGFGEASLEDVAAECGMTTDEVVELMQISREVSSLDAPVGAEEDSNFGDFIESDGPRPEEMVLESSMKESVRKIVETLPQKEQDILRLRYGLDGNDPMSLKEVGEVYNLTKERIRQIEKKALSRLSEVGEEQDLMAFIA